MEYYAVSKHGHVTVCQVGSFLFKMLHTQVRSVTKLIVSNIRNKEKILGVATQSGHMGMEWIPFPFFFSFNLVCSGLHPSVSNHYRVLWSCVSSSVTSIFSVQLPSDSKGGDPNMSCRRVISGQAAHPSGRTPCRPFFGSGPWLCTQLLCRLDKYSMPRNLLFDTWLSFHISMYFICYM